MMMKRLFMAAIAATALTAQAQERKIEIAPFAGGYFSTGFQGFQYVPILGRGEQADVKPWDEPNSAIFGGRASYDVSRRFAVEGTIGFSPAGLRNEPINYPLLAGAPDFFFDPFAFFLPSDLPLKNSNTFQYSGNALFHWRKGNNLSPFLTGGIGAVQRTADYDVSGWGIRPGSPRPSNPTPSPNPGGSTGSGPVACLSCPIFFPLPDPGMVSFSVNFGGGVKKYLTDRMGIRLDVRDYVSTLNGDTVNNIEVSFGIIFRQ